ncbi:response regulator [Flavobacterium branchiicola]|uniref:Response regulator n=1 Tax=Flavobacterium branchiicola TaxID=1114875 RepID=A0ABV9PA45_9FLAO|nr:response regulator [Flavobacterium branchiicola]
MADDDEDDRMLFLDAMLELNLSVVVEAAVDGLELLDMLSQAVQQLPEIIFLDINMPGKNGFECLEEIRSAKGEMKDVKIIMLSTSSNPENIELCYELGADLYAVKPSTFEDLKKLLLKVFQLDWYAVKKGNKRILMA